MAKSSIQKLRQRKDKAGNLVEKLCCVCGKPLIVGEQYKSVWNYYNSWDMHVECYHKCPRSRWESSEYRGRIYDIQDNLDRDDIDTTLSELEDLKYELEDKFNNIPEQLQYGNAGEILQERIDALDEAISNIENYKYELDDIMNYEYEEYKDDYETEEEFEDFKENEIDDKVSSIEDELYNLDI